MSERSDFFKLITAGAFDSPKLLKLLMFSGIGNAEHLRSLDIPVVWRRCRAACGHTVSP
ncbi:MAG: GMC family oxidoreductase N-terminal domain-containing protein [Nostoc sp. DedSLP03]|uniref:GMC family oxidoreductase N-terminal domain-containing protein n=1 Tax=Nostoc sp. DedSLP03 TaxID=3075400 RepID=UPI002AD377FC|nr:GMC family oxidoreductase N-terminal domain-containing protein [Nostoc sp. DedSLP03]MDZ7970078.1 GMC family oxidoreductase N-terminal domain-containing protein [Nostoc sp. DedSLP03]